MPAIAPDMRWRPGITPLRLLMRRVGQVLIRALQVVVAQQLAQQQPKKEIIVFLAPAPILVGITIRGLHLVLANRYRAGKVIIAAVSFTMRADDLVDQPQWLRR